MNKKRYITVFIIFMLLVLGVISIRQKLVLKLLHPRLYEEYVETYSKEFSIDENLVYSIMKVESKFNKNAISNKKAKGLMQISDITQKWAQDELKLGKVDIFDPETNIKIGCWYLSKLYKEFNDLDLVIAAYNGGSGNVNKWLNDEAYSKDGNKLHEIPFNETKNYLGKVKENYIIYKSLYGEEEANEKN
ncbi:lytic transglycosylase domain-containing protein [Paraclostridium bifermentans]|nr:transglycosylase SLT domain-containing protein [Paraclostridium bifermentans]MBN8046232.1 lytic transglycosylase domain-containing protein [Paraclostridium bifermentans]